MARLSREFYLGDTVDIARRLLGTDVYKRQALHWNCRRIYNES